MNEIEELIHRRRRQILIHSYLYYQMNTNIISDHMYDSLCKELAELQQNHPTESNNVEFYKEDFKLFDGSTGFDLPKDDWLHVLSQQLLAEHRKVNNLK